MSKHTQEHVVYLEFVTSDGHQRPGILARVARSWLERLEGLLRTPREEAGELLILRCPSIHTFGMAYPIDVAFIGEGQVLRVDRAVRPGRVLRAWGATCVLERPSCEGAWLRRGDLMRLRYGCGCFPLELFADDEWVDDGWFGDDWPREEAFRMPWEDYEDGPDDDANREGDACGDGDAAGKGSAEEPGGDEGSPGEGERPAPDDERECRDEAAPTGADQPTDACFGTADSFASDSADEVPGEEAA